MSSFQRLFDIDDGSVYFCCHIRCCEVSEKVSEKGWKVGFWLFHQAGPKVNPYQAERVTHGISRRYWIFDGLWCDQLILSKARMRHYYGIRAWLDLPNQTTSYKSSLPFDGFSWQVGLHKVPCIFFLNFYFAIENLLLVMPKYLEMACVLLDHTFFGYNTYDLKCLPPTPPPSKMKTCHRQLFVAISVKLTYSSE